MAFPTADQIARIVVTACTITGDSGPVQVVMGAGGNRARVLAWAVMNPLFPDIPCDRLAKKIGYGGARPGTNANAALAMARKRMWWCEEWVETAIGVYRLWHGGEDGAALGIDGRADEDRTANGSSRRLADRGRA